MTAQGNPSNRLLVGLSVLIIVWTGASIWNHFALMREVRELLNEKASLTSSFEERVAAEDSARFVNANLQTVETFGSRPELLEFGVEQADSSIDGLFCEFGVYRGITINIIASKTEATVHGFDSFEGLPEKWREGFDEGTFKMNGLPRVRDNVVLHKGWFDETVPRFAEQHPGPIAFLHMDADLYSSTKTVFDGLGDQIVEGTIIVFDEFLYYPGWQVGEFKAFHEMVEERRMSFEYIGRVEEGQQVAVRITGLP
jgi:hypothetical protein